MNQTYSRVRLFFCTFSGEDDFIIRQCSSRIQNAFAFIGLFVTIIFIGCWVSAYLFMSQLFEGSLLPSVFVAITWALLVTNLYLLLLYTISPALLPIASNAKGKNAHLKNDLPADRTPVESAFTFSLVIRLILLILLAIIIAQPFNVLIFSPSFEESHFYAREMRSILASHPSAWLICAFFSTLFLMPVYWKYAIRNRGGFYEKKREIETQFVQDSYADFKYQYASLFREKMQSFNRQTWTHLMPLLNQLEKQNAAVYAFHYQQLNVEMTNEPIEKYEYWVDHPFRTVRKEVARNLSSEEEFLKDIYSENA